MMDFVQVKHLAKIPVDRIRLQATVIPMQHPHGYSFRIIGILVSIKEIKYCHF
jgi:hypothetical protein